MCIRDSREHCQVTMIDFMAAEEDNAAILRSPLSCLISDATYPTEGMPHPRVYGSCTRLPVSYTHLDVYKRQTLQR